MLPRSICELDPHTPAPPSPDLSLCEHADGGRRGLNEREVTLEVAMWVKEREQGYVHLHPGQKGRVIREALERGA